MAKIITELAAPWRYEVCPYSDTVDLLTVGGIRVKGQWQGRLGEHYMAWMPLPKRDKRKELELKLGTDFLPDNFKAPPKYAPAVRKSWVVPELASPIHSLKSNFMTTSTPTDFNQLAAEVYAANAAVGWWDNPKRNVYELLQLVVTEISEATEGERKDLMDDHLPNRKMGEVELADALIRLLDMAGGFGWTYRVGGKPLLPRGLLTASNKGEVHFRLTQTISELGMSLQFGSPQASVDRNYTSAVDAILLAGGKFGYNVLEAMQEKLLYNTQRLDHKREVRARVGGKKF